MTVIRSWSGDGLSGGSLTVDSAGSGDTVFSSISGGVFTVEQLGDRQPRILWPVTAGAHQVRWNNLGDLNSWAVRRYFSVSEVPAVTWGILTGHANTGSDLFRVEFNSLGQLRYRSASAAVYSPASYTIVADTVYRIEVIGVADGSSSVYLYEGDSMVPLLSSEVSVTAGSLDEVRFGHHNSVAVTGETGDDFAIADQAILIGAVEPETEPPGPVIERKWSGDSLTAGALTTTSAGPDDTAFSTVTGSLMIETSGRRSPRIRIPDAAGIKRVHWWPLNSTLIDSYAVRWYQTFNGYSPSEIYLANGLGGGDSWSVRMTPDGRIRLRDDAAAVVRWTGSVSMPVSTSLRFEMVVDHGAATLRVYRSDYQIILDSASVVLSSSDIDELRFGFSSSVQSSGITYDDIVFRSVAQEIGPALEAPPPYTHFRKNSNEEWVPQVVEML